ncbi:tubulin polyglutamylase TTLL5 isoform X5 [Diorhabda carinulata]|uniref:tubulin polyglutamylase TTLL5 isoform X5 n=1 Tax=Diorhabda carinulata TaxID=1163345 RepID=UPI0025A29ADA|nr:tubulin polyglutamylase TTLL5 isoform X5 [Diorhabda carinulata]
MSKPSDTAGESKNSSSLQQNSKSTSNNSSSNESLKVEETETIQSNEQKFNEIPPEVPVSKTSQEAWISGGTLGSRNTVLIFKSSALANASEELIQQKPAYKLHITYKVLQAESKLLSKLLDCHGVTEVAPNSSDFNLLWTGSHPKPGLLWCTIRSLAPHQRVNHFPRSYELTRKDRLYKNIERMQHAKGFKNFDFIPQTFVMPIEYRELCSTHHRVKGPWIVKPVASSRGRGIFIVETPNQVPLEEPVVVAKYISNPLLVAGHKCDLRLYVVVTNFDPLIIYIYEEGLVRFATVKYDASHKQLWNPCMHLCNYSINKYHSDYVKSDDPSAENVGHKWTLSALLRHLKSEGKDTALLMSQIEDVIIKAILACANSVISACKMFVPYTNNCFELYGFDILIDKMLKPWLLEVNLSPSLNCDSPLDVRLKSAMLADLLSLVGIPAVDPIIRINGDYQKSNFSLKSNFNHCRRVHSADGLASTSSSLKKGAHTVGRGPSPYTAEEAKMIRLVTSEFKRRGGFVRIFPSADSWMKYSQYLDRNTGIPLSGNPGTNFCLSGQHNYNLLIYAHFYPDIPVLNNPNERNQTRSRQTMLKRDISIESHKVGNKTLNGRQDRYERMLSQGHRSSLAPCKITRETHCLDIKKRITDMLETGKRITQWQARKTFSHYLACILRRIVKGPDQDDHVEIVLKFMQKASNYLRTPFNVKTPSQKLDYKDRAAVVAKQLNDFLYLYNRETDLYVDKTERASQIPKKIYNEFLEHARESDLEELLIYQTTQNVPSYATNTTFPGLLKCIPAIPKHYGLKPPCKANKSKSGMNKPLAQIEVPQ